MGFIINFSRKRKPFFSISHGTIFTQKSCVGPGPRIEKTLAREAATTCGPLGTAQSLAIRVVWRFPFCHGGTPSYHPRKKMTMD